MRRRCSQFVLLASLLAIPATTIRAADNSSKKSEPEINERYKSLETLARGLFYLETMYVDPDKVSQDKLVDSALGGIVSNLDPHTIVMPSKAFEQLTIDTQGKFGGVGIIVSSENGRLIVVSPIEDTPAYRAGIKSGDEILAIDGEMIKNIKTENPSDRMRGRPDTKIKLVIKRQGEKDTKEYVLNREIIKVKSVRSYDLDDGILYARISNFQEETSEELESIIQRHKGQVKGIILDLRDNPGGLLDQAVKVADLFIESGVIVSTVGRRKEDIEREFAHARGTYKDFPMICLINGGSASASEIVAGALQDHDRALIMGTTSFGKGSVQTLISLPNRAGLKLTVARYFTPKDRSIQARGIQPDIFISADQQKAEGKDQKKESDLKGHIESQDLSELATTPSAMLGNIKNWPEPVRKDHQLVTAYTYLRGWGVFQKAKDMNPTKTKESESARL